MLLQTHKILKSLRIVSRQFGKYAKAIEGEGFNKRIFILNEENKKISGWHDIPLFTPKPFVFNAIFEIPL